MYSGHPGDNVHGYKHHLCTLYYIIGNPLSGRKSEKCCLFKSIPYCL